MIIVGTSPEHSSCRCRGVIDKLTNGIEYRDRGRSESETELIIAMATAEGIINAYIDHLSERITNSPDI